MKHLFKLVASHKELPILRDTILFDGNQAKATDLDLFATIDGAWNFDKPTLVSIALIKTALAMSKKPVWAGNTLNGITLTQSDTYAVEDYPWLQKPFEGAALSFNAPLQGIIDKLMPACANKDIRYYLNGVCFDLTMGAMVATDGHRLHIEYDAFVSTAGAAIIRRANFDLVKPTGIELSNTHAKVTHEGGFIISKLIDGQFPDHQRVVPDLVNVPNTFQVNGAQFDAVDTLVKVNKANKDEFGAVLICSNGTISARGIGLPFCPPLPSDYGFHDTYIADAIKAAGSGTMHFADNCENSAMVISGNFRAVVMPMRV